MSIFFTACCLAWPLGCFAEDLDIYRAPAMMPDEPINVLVVLDNSSNWTDGGAGQESIVNNVKAALSNVFRDGAGSAVTIGLMLYVQGEAEDARGAYVRAAVRTMDTVSAEHYARQLKSLDVHRDAGADGQLVLALAEAYRYFAGDVATSGPGRQKTDGSYGMTSQASVAACRDATGSGLPAACAGSLEAGVADKAVWSLPGPAISNGRYQSPSRGTGCNRNLIVFISLGANPNNAAASRLAATRLGQLAPAQEPAGALQSIGADEITARWARFMALGELGITTHVIEVAPGLSAGEQSWSDSLQHIADAANGEYLRTDTSVSDIHAAIERVMAGVTAVGATIAPVALPVSAYDSGTFRNQVFMSQFRPNVYGRLRWQGNLKQYQLGYSAGAGTDELFLVDADKQRATEDASGRLRQCARSHWTPISPDTYWRHLLGAELAEACPTGSQNWASNTPDGATVEKGGQAYVGRGGAAYANATATQRVVKTAAAEFCGGSIGVDCSLQNFDETNAGISSGALGAVSEQERQRYISWARGADTEDEDGDGNRIEYRPSLHGDAIHSRPLAVDYATDKDAQQLAVFYGSNDGLLRAINGNVAAADADSGVIAGAEFWSFMPPEFYPHIGKLLRNTHYRDAGGSEKIYGPDGPLTTWQDENGRHFLAMAMRRGGRTVYGFDISDPGAPSLRWRVGCVDMATGAESCAAGWEGTGQTWSPLQVAWQPGFASPLLVMGGGYDQCEDVIEAQPSTQHPCTGTATGGTGIYVVDAHSGDVVVRFATERAVPGRVTIVGRAERDRNISYAYAADTGGNIYRLSGPGGEEIGATPPLQWEIKRIASLGCGPDSGDVCVSPRKFLSGPDVVRNPGTASFTILIGSGDTEKPASSVTVAQQVQNYFFALTDSPTQVNPLEPGQGRCNSAPICLESLTSITPDSAVPSADTAGSNGWKMPLLPGEKVVATALTLNNRVYFSTHRPDPAPSSGCFRGLGIAARYSVDYRSGKGISTVVPGGGLLAAPVAGRVSLDEGQVVPFCIGCTGERAASGSVGLEAPTEIPGPRGRVFWRAMDSIR